ncbi:MAG TPA: polysaccharide pyruvyl transferase family protein [Pseudonocardia sp.]|nr:polysaccharide pyruvyl transferase family protein [Pseudonocardia sp.]
MGTRACPQAPTIGVLGSYGGLNVGDEAILTSVLADLRALRPRARLVVFSRDPGHTREHHGVDEVVAWETADRRATADSAACLDLLVLGGGGVLYDGEAGRYLRLVQAAHRAGVPVFVHAVGAGPLRDPHQQAAVRDALAGVADLVVRDEESRRVLEDAGVDREIVVTADPALLLPPARVERECLARAGVPDGVRLVGVSVREPGRAAEHLDEDGYHALLATVADFLAHRIDAYLVFLPMERDDVRHAHSVLSRMADPSRGRILHGPHRPADVLGLMRHLELVVGMRLHVLVFAALAGVPFLPLPYAGKVFDFARVTGAPLLRGVVREQAGPLIAEIDRLWDERSVRAPAVRERVAALVARAAVTRERLAAVLAAGPGVVPATVPAYPEVR